MTEGSCYDRELAALAIKQARGDLVEAIFLLRAYRTTLPRFGDIRAARHRRMVAERRISATFKDVPGGQVLGPTFDYTHRLLDFALAADGERPAGADGAGRHDARPAARRRHPRARRPARAAAGRRPAQRADLTREPLALPGGAPGAPAEPGARRRGLPAGARLFDPARLRQQPSLRRRDPLRRGAGVASCPRSWASPIEIGEIDVTECQMVNQFAGSHDEPPQFTRGYGLAFGHAERKAMAMALVDRALRAEELSEKRDVAGAGRGVRAVPLRQRRGVGLRAASEAAALRRFPVRAGGRARAARRGRGAPQQAALDQAAE